MYQYMNLQSGGPDDGYKKQSFFRRHWFLTFCSICFFLLCAYVYVMTGGRPLETVQLFLDGLTEDVVKDIAPAQSVKSAWELAEDDKQALRPAIDKYFESGTHFKMQPCSDDEIAGLKRQYPVLADNKGYFTRIDGIFFYVSNDGQRIYDCEVDGELLADKMAREAQQKFEQENVRNTVSSNQSVDETGIVIYSPSTLNGDGLDSLTKDPAMKGIFRDADGTWRNY